MIAENELTQYPSLFQCVQQGKVISDSNLPDMLGFFPVVDRNNWQIKGFVYADAPADRDGYVLASYDINDSRIFESENGDFLVEAE